MVRNCCIAVGLAVVLATQASGQVGFDPTDPEDPFGGIYAFPGVAFPVSPAVGLQGAAPSAVEGELQALQRAANQLYADPASTKGVEIDPAINHQPLIHVKVRIVEVQRADSLAVSSVLDFITTPSAGMTPFGTAPFNNTINGSNQRLAGITRMTLPGLIGVDGSGTGMLVNLSSAHINYVAGLLATELNADVITAPQVTTLNGKTVQFRSGSKVPFALGANVIASGGSNTIQEFFYKHVGTYVRVTPQIVNWGRNHEGLGTVPPKYATNTANPLFGNEDIYEPFAAARILLMDPFRKHLSDNEIALLSAHMAAASPDVAAAQHDVRVALNKIMTITGWTRSQINQLLGKSVAPPLAALPDACAHCTWKPSECTINLNLSVRLSDLGQSDAAGTRPNSDDVVEININNETNVRAIANEVQVKSGYGAVIGGLITMRDVERVSKVPVVGDLPLVGAAFRSKTTERVKTETLIFVEAEVLPSFECAGECGQPLVKAKTAQDFCNGKSHLQGELCDGPLHYGMHRAGLLGDYLPRPSHGELEYWRYYHHTIHHQRHHKVTTHVLDTLE